MTHSLEGRVRIHLPKWATWIQGKTPRIWPTARVAGCSTCSRRRISSRLVRIPCNYWFSFNWLPHCVSTNAQQSECVFLAESVQQYTQLQIHEAPSRTFQRGRRNLCCTPCEEALGVKRSYMVVWDFGKAFTWLSVSLMSHFPTASRLPL